MKSDEEIAAEVNAIIGGYGAYVTGITADGVGIQGDKRVYGPGVTIFVPKDLGPEKVAEISTMIINEVTGITRVLIDIPTAPTNES